MSSPAPGPLRAAVERRSAVLLAELGRRPRWLLPVVCALLLGGVVFLPPAAAIACLVVLLALVGWLTYLSWPLADGPGRALRLGGLALLVVLGVASVAS